MDRSVTSLLRQPLQTGLGAVAQQRLLLLDVLDKLALVLISLDVLISRDNHASEDCQRADQLCDVVDGICVNVHQAFASSKYSPTSSWGR